MAKQGTCEAEKWVRLASYPNAESAHLAEQQLRAEDIPCYIDNENVASTLWHLQPALDGVRVCVLEQDVERAREIIAPQVSQDADAELEQHYEDAPGRIAYAALDRCPRCHSKDTEPLSWGWRLMQSVIVLFLGAFLAWHPLVIVALFGYAVYFLLTKPSHRCLHCGYRWTATAQA